MKIRILKNSDYKVIQDLNRELIPVSTIKPDELSEKEIKTMFMSGRTKNFESRIVETAEGAPVGFIYTIYNPDFLKKKFIKSVDLDKTLYLYCIAVKKKYQNKGFGKILWNEVLRIAKKRDKDIILLCVNNQNERAYTWYQNLGFFELASNVWMTKRIK